MMAFFIGQKVLAKLGYVPETHLSALVFAD
jgi:hypothetical protein